MSNKAYLSIRDFYGKGKNLRTPIESWDFGFPRNSSSWSSASTGLDRPLIVSRKKDKLSHYFAGMAFRSQLIIEDGAWRSKESFSEVSLVLSVFNINRGLVSQTIYDLFEVGVTGYEEAMGRERVRLDFKKAFETTTSVERITSP
jgi:hypothetical protein